MESADLRPIEMRARRAYELTRVRRAALAFAPVVLLIVGAALIGERVGYILAFGSALFLLGAGLLWYGRGVKRAVLPGLAAGLVPLIFGLCAKYVHTCMGAGCLAFCVPTCFAGGLIAGVVVDFVGLRSATKMGFWVAASGIGLLTGAMGCVCAGALGLAGLMVGFAIGAAPGMVAAALRRRRAA
jgi:hypothetical protein